MKHIRRRRITIQQEEFVIVRKSSIGRTALSEEELFDVCPTCGTHLLFADLSPALQSSAASEVAAYSATELPVVACEHESSEPLETNKGDS